MFCNQNMSDQIKVHICSPLYLSIVELLARSPAPSFTRTPKSSSSRSSSPSAPIPQGTVPPFLNTLELRRASFPGYLLYHYAMNITGLSSKPKKPFGVSGSPMGFRDRRTKLRRVGASAEHFGARDAEVLAALYPSPLSFYDSVPGCDLSLADFEGLAVERLKLLRIMEKHSQVRIPLLGCPCSIIT